MNNKAEDKLQQDVENVVAVKRSTVLKATSWSFLGELVAKLVMPISNMILARLLTPEIFGVVATVNMVVHFSDIFAEAGFKLYIIQRNFKDDEEVKRYSSTALWASLFVGIVIWFFIFIYRDPLTALVGSPGYGVALAVASLSIPLVAVSAILSALYSRYFDYKPLFLRRLICLAVPFVVTIPAAALGYGVWALICGALCTSVINVVTLLFNPYYRPKFYFNIKHVVEMTPFCLSTMATFFLSWATNWLDIIFVGRFMGEYYVGLYKNTQALTAGILALFTSSLTPILFNLLSRYQNDDDKFCTTMRGFTEKLALILLPIGFGTLVCDRFVTDVMLGSQWKEASDFIGIWGLCTVFSAVYATYCREACRAKGKPNLAMLAQAASLAVVIPVSYYSSQIGFRTLAYWRSFAGLTLIPFYYVILFLAFKINPLRFMTATIESFVSSIIMAFVIVAIHSSFEYDLLGEIGIIIIGICVYLGVISCFPKKRRQIVGAYKAGANLLLTKINKKRRIG